MNTPLISRALLFMAGLIELITITGAVRADGSAGLTGPQDFALIAKEGFKFVVNGGVDPITGDPVLVPNPQNIPNGHMNGDPWAMTHFLGNLYVGTLRNTACYNNSAGAIYLVGVCPPLNFLGVPAYDDDDRAEIWRYAPGNAPYIAGTWSRVHQSTVVGTTPRQIGYRSAIVCNANGPSTGPDRAYVAGVGPFAQILYSANGNTFQTASILGLNVGPLGDNGYSRLECFRNANGVTTLVASPIGRPDDNDIAKPGRALILMNRNPSNALSSWQTVSTSGFGNPDNLGIFNLKAFNGSLYMPVTNRTTGAEYWRTTGCTGPASLTPCNATYVKLLDQGGGRSRDEDGELINRAPAIDLDTFDLDDDGIPEYLYATLGNNGGRGGAAELIRFNTINDNWELVAGQPRLNIDTNPILGFHCANPSTIDGVGTNNDCAPLSGMGPGFGGGAPEYEDGDAGYFWKIVSHDSDGDGHKEMYLGTLGADLWRSEDGVHFTKIVSAGFGVPQAIGIRNMASTGQGLYVGISNRSVNHPNGGAHVYLGTCAPDGPLVADARVQLKAAAPGQVVFDEPNQRYIAYDDENSPASGNNFVAITLDGGKSANRYCGSPIATYQWYQGDLTGSCGTLTSGTPGFVASSASPTHPISSLPTGDHTYTLKVITADDAFQCDKVVVKASANLPPTATISTPNTATLTLIDADGDGSEQVTLGGSCSDPDGDGITSCGWSVDLRLPGVTFADAGNPNTTATVATTRGGGGGGGGGGAGSTFTLVLTAKDSQGNQGTGSVGVRVRAAVHDVAVTAINLTTSPATQGSGETVQVTVRNQGNVPESFNVSLTATPGGAGSTSPAQSVVNLDPDTDQLLSFAWTPNSGGNYTLTAIATTLAGETDTADNSLAIPVSVQAGSNATPAVPTAVSATSLGNRQVQVSWADNSSSETRYEVRRCRLVGSICAWSTVVNNLGADATSYTSTVTQAGTYRFGVRACNTSCSAWSANSNNVVVP